MRKYTTSLLIIMMLIVAQITKAQTNLKTYDFKDFDKVQIENINGEVEIELVESGSLLHNTKNTILPF